MLNSKKGFTLIELLIVIAIIALLVSVIIPAVTNSAVRAKAAADAANLRSILAEVNTRLVMNENIDQISCSLTAPDSKTAPGAKIRIYYEYPAGLDAYFVTGSKFYSINYLSGVAEAGSSSLPTSSPAGMGVWYELGVGKLS